MSYADLPSGIYFKDARHMDEIETGSVTLVISSPPYNVDLEYEKGKTFDEWLSTMRDVLKECNRVMMDGGRACINVASTGRNPYVPLYKHVIDITVGLGWWMRATFIWLKGVAGTSTAWGSYKSATNPIIRDNHEFILAFSKGKESIPPGDSGITGDEFMEFTKAEWHFSPASASSIGHPAPFPDELPRRCILLYSNTGDTVLDPFLGSGTTYKVARLLGRKPIGYEMNDKYANIIKQRVIGNLDIQSVGWEHEMEMKSKYPGLCNKSTRTLRDLAKKMGIPRYLPMNRSMLIRSIVDGTKYRRLDDFARPANPT
jgi:site-specific DNA-methyltransferase (adenine-specific)